MKKLLQINILLILLFSPVLRPLYAEVSPGLISKQKRFVRELFSNKMYFECISETGRLLEFSRDLEDSDSYLFFINVNYFLGEQYRTVVYNLNKKIEGLDFRERILASQSYLRLGLFDDSYKIIENLDYRFIGSQNINELFLRKCEVHLWKRDYNKILFEIERVGEHLPEKYYPGELEKDIVSYKKYGFKSIGASIALSIFIPGAGQMYSGKYWQGGLSFLSVASTAIGAYFSYVYNQKEISYTLMFFSSIFYLGNIYGAYNSARDANNRIHKKFISEIKGKYIPAYNPGSYINIDRMFGK